MIDAFEQLGRFTSGLPALFYADEELPQSVLLEAVRITR
jgi:hypothetical protein